MSALVGVTIPVVTDNSASEWLEALNRLADLTFTRLGKPLQSVTMTAEAWQVLVSEVHPDAFAQHGDETDFTALTRFGPVKVLRGNPQKRGPLDVPFR